MLLLSVTLKASLTMNVILEAVSGSIGLPVINLHRTLFTEYMNIVLISITFPFDPTFDDIWKTDNIGVPEVRHHNSSTYLITKPRYLITNYLIKLVF